MGASMTVSPPAAQGRSMPKQTGVYAVSAIPADLTGYAVIAGPFAPGKSPAPAVQHWLILACPGMPEPPNTVETWARPGTAWKWADVLKAHPNRGPSVGLAEWTDRDGKPGRGPQKDVPAGATVTATDIPPAVWWVDGEMED